MSIEVTGIGSPSALHPMKKIPAETELFDVIKVVVVQFQKDFSKKRKIKDLYITVTCIESYTKRLIQDILKDAGCSCCLVQYGLQTSVVVKKHTTYDASAKWHHAITE